jgi:hypothetical protein
VTISSGLSRQRRHPKPKLNQRQFRFPAAARRSSAANRPAVSDGRSLYDALGPNYTLVRVDPKVSVSGIVEAAAQRGVPLAVLDLDVPDARAIYIRKLTLVRPDQHVAWRGDEEPTAPLDLVDLVRGVRSTSTRKAKTLGWVLH